MDWQYRGEAVTQETFDGFAGFVYEIRDTQTGKLYIGKKKSKANRTLAPLKGQKRKRKIVKPSDWATYYGSSEEVKALVVESGSDRFDRTIIRLCKTTAEMSYMETREIFMRDILLRPDAYYNSFVGCRIHRNHLKHLFKDKEQ